MEQRYTWNGREGWQHGTRTPPVGCVSRAVWALRRALDDTPATLSGIHRLRQTFQLRAPVILLTAQGEELDKVKGLQLGADDYLTKPFSHLELFARINAVLGRTQDRVLPGLAPVGG